MYSRAIRSTSTMALGLLSALSLFSSLAAAEGFITARVAQFSDRGCENQIGGLELVIPVPALDVPFSTTQLQELVTPNVAGSITVQAVAAGCVVQVGGAGFGFDKIITTPPLDSCLGLVFQTGNQLIDVNVDKYRVTCQPGATTL